MSNLKNSGISNQEPDLLVERY